MYHLDFDKFKRTMESIFQQIPKAYSSNTKSHTSSFDASFDMERTNVYTYNIDIQDYKDLVLMIINTDYIDGVPLSKWRITTSEIEFSPDVWTDRSITVDVGAYLTEEEHFQKSTVTDIPPIEILKCINDTIQKIKEVYNV